METKITLLIKSVYGTTYIYPVCETSMLLLKLTRRKTFLMEDIATLKALGYEIEQTHERLEL